MVDNKPQSSELKARKGVVLLKCRKNAILQQILFFDLDFLSILPLGSRGLFREIWTSTIKHTLSDIASLDSLAADYHAEDWTESSSPEDDTFNKNSGYSSKITGFFVAPQDDNYKFYIMSDDTSELFLSLTGDPADKVLRSVSRMLYKTMSSRDKSTFASPSLFSCKRQFFHREFSLRKPDDLRALALREVNHKHIEI